jgi:hypothetical protein
MLIRGIPSRRRKVTDSEESYHANAIACAGQIVAEHANVLGVHARSEC